MIATYAAELKGGFFPYVEQVCVLVRVGLGRHMIAAFAAQLKKGFSSHVERLRMYAYVLLILNWHFLFMLACEHSAFQAMIQSILPFIF